jgi:phage-related protein/predicted XRE-type DNA-binding protein
MEVVPVAPEQPRKLIWLVDSLVRLTGFPPTVRKKLGFALYQSQIGQRHESAKILHGFTETVWQVRADDPSGTYRTVYAAQLGEAVYVLHAFQKKATSGIATPTKGIGSDPSTASTCAQAGGEMRREKMPNREFTPSSGNVFADLNLPHADDLLAKAELAAKIIAEIQRRRLTQSQAAAILGIDQPKVSALKQGKLSGFSIERLMRLLLVLGRDIEITVKERSRPGSIAKLRVA